MTKETGLPPYPAYPGYPGCTTSPGCAVCASGGGQRGKRQGATSAGPSRISCSQAHQRVDATLGATSSLQVRLSR